MSTHTERWKEITLGGISWLVSDLGNIKAPARVTRYSRTRNGAIQEFSSSFPERSLSPYKEKNGYLEVSRLQDRKRSKERVHRLVALAFCEGHSEGLTVNHIDGVKTNNRADNLEWVSLADNTKHQWQTGLVDLRGESAPGHKLSSKQVVYIRRLLSQGVPAHALAIVAGVSSSLIALIRDGKRRSVR